MHEYGQFVMPRDAFEHREELRLVHWPAIDAGADLDAARAEFFYGAVHFLQRSRHVVHGQRGDECGEFFRPLAHHLGHAIVGNARKFRRKFGAAERIGRGQGQRQHLPHIGEFFIQHGHPRLDVPEHAQAGHAFDNALILGVLLHQLQVGGGHDVVVDVDFHGFGVWWGSVVGEIRRG